MGAETHSGIVRFHVARSVTDRGPFRTDKRSQVKGFLAAGTITEGDVVCMEVNSADSTRRFTHVQAIPVSLADTKGMGGVIGVAGNSAVLEGDVEVFIAGFCPKINCASGVAEYEELITSSAVAGRAISFAYSGSFAGTLVAMPFGYAISGESANFTSGWIRPQGF